jgi:hypothetical protein
MRPSENWRFLPRAQAIYLGANRPKPAAAIAAAGAFAFLFIGTVLRMQADPECFLHSGQRQAHLTTHPSQRPAIARGFFTARHTVAEKLDQG